MDWHTSEPPIGREIEFEIDNREIRRGSLALSGTYSSRPGRLPSNPGKQMYRMEGDGLVMFDVTRWREAD